MSSREDRVGEAVAWYFQAAEGGTQPDRAAFLERFPDLRPELESFLADKGAFDRAAGPPAPARPDPDATVPPAANTDTATMPPASVPPADPNATVPRADSYPAADPDPSLGAVRYFGDYELLSEIARGGMGVVFRARQVSLNREVALKMILTGQLASAADVIRFRAEAEAAANLDHPNILPIYEVGEHQGQQYFAMKLVPGGSLGAKVGPWVGESRTAVGVFVKVCRAVDFAHRRGILHRDLKPGNILLDLDGTPFVTDFGLAKKVDGDSNLTQSGAIVGTPSYMAPEQARAEKGLTTAADVYALGAILYELLTGRPPFRGPTVLDTVLQVIEKEPADPRAVNPKADRDLSVIALKCLEKKPEKRYESAGALADDLDRWARGEPIVAREVTRGERAVKWVKRNPVVAGAAAALVLVLTAGVAVSSWFAYQAGEEATAARAAEADALSQKARADERAEAARKAEAVAKEREKAEAVAKADADREAKTARQATERAESEKHRAEDQLRRAEWLVYAGKLSLAHTALEEKNWPLAFASLDECQGNLRGWEHRHLRLRLEDSKQTLRGHTGPVYSVVFSPDGKRVVTGSGPQFNPNEPGEVKVWDADTGREVLALKGHTRRVYSVAFSPDGKRIVTGSQDGTAKVWEVPSARREGFADTGTATLTLKGAGGVVAFSPDGKRVVAGSQDGTARVWDAEKGIELFPLQGHSAWVNSVCFSPDGKRILTGSGSTGQTGEVKVWDADTGTALLTLKGYTGPVFSVCFSPDGTRIATGSGYADGPNARGEVKVWEVPSARREGFANTGTEVLALKGHIGKGHTGSVTSVCFSPDGTRIVTGSQDGTARVWDADTGAELLALKGHKSVVTSVCFSPDGTRIVTGSQDGTARVCDAEKGIEVLALKGHTAWVSSVAFSPDGKRVVTGSRDNTARVWAADTGTAILTLKGHTGGVGSVAFSPDGKRIVTVSDDNTAKVWEVPSARREGFADTGTAVLTLTLKGHADYVSGVCFSPDGTRIAIGIGEHDGRNYIGEVKVWDPAKDAEILTLKGHTGPVNGVAFSPDGKRILTGSGYFGQTGGAKVWDAETGAELLALRGHTLGVSSVCFSPDGTRIVTGSWDFTARVWDADTGTELLALKGHTGSVTSATFSPDGTRIVTGSQDGTARVWDADTGTELLAIKGHKGVISSVAFSPDGRRIATGGGYLEGTNGRGEVKVWDAAKDAEVLALKGHTGQLSSVCYSPDGTRIVTGSWDFTARVWDAAKGTAVLTLKGHTNQVSSVFFSPDGKRIVTGSNDQTAKVWDAGTGTELLALKGHTGGVGSVAFSPDGKRIVTGSNDNTAKVWDAGTGTEVLALNGHTKGVASVCFSPDGTRIVTGSWDFTARVWDADTGIEILALKRNYDQMTAVAFSPDGTRILTGSYDAARVWDAAKGTEILALRGHKSGVTSVAFSPDGKRIITGSNDKTAKVWDAAKGTAVLALNGHTAWVNSVCFSPDGTRIVTGSNDKTARVWDAAKGGEVLALKGHAAWVKSVCFRSDGTRLFAWDIRNKVLAWAVSDGKPVSADRAPARPGSGPARSPDGRFAARPDGNGVTVVDLLAPPRGGDSWPFPDAAERTRYHTEQAARAEKEKQWFAVAFHLGRLLLDAPGDADLTRRRAEALQKHAAVPTGPGVIPIAK